jgi:6-phosphogluconate dehydrogenase
MKLGMVGAGRMGASMAGRLLRGGVAVAVYDANPAPLAALKDQGAETAASLEELVALLPARRVLWMMLPAGPVTETVAEKLGALLGRGDVLVDGGNSFYKDAIRRAAAFQARGIEMVDCGTSGGVWGAERGYCLMVGGSAEAFRLIEPALKLLAPGEAGLPPSPGREGRVSTAHQGYLHCGPPGAGHFVKMVHNGIEYGLMQALAEGFALLQNGGAEVPLPLADIAELWRRGSVLSSWLLDLGAAALAQDESLARFHGHVDDSGEGRWTLEAAVERAVPAPVLAAALFARFSSRGQAAYADKLLSALREQFGGHRES